MLARIGRGPARRPRRTLLLWCLAAAFVLLLVVFRSTVIAVSSIVFNPIGVAASFGFATLLFQHGRLITNAALIVIVVFVAFGVTGPIPPTELGVTLALAVALDATVIRMMLVPSLLGMLGERAWSLPSWLDRRPPCVSFDH